MRSAKDYWRILSVVILAYGACAAQERSIDRLAKRKVEIDVNDNQRIEVKAKIDPVEFTQHHWHTNWETLDNLRAAQPTKEYSAGVLRAFLLEGKVSVGDSWKVKPAAVELLKQLHEGATMNLHINSHAKGGWAILRAINQQWAEIAFRLHGQFVLKDGWFTPSQFSGRIVLERNTGNVIYFRMHVPKYVLNFNVGRKLPISIPGIPPDDVVDAGGGFCPRIELMAGSRKAADDIEWDCFFGFQTGANANWHCDSIPHGKSIGCHGRRRWKKLGAWKSHYM